MKYNITIKDNETGEVMQVFDTNVIIGTIGAGEGEAHSICLSKCTKPEIAGAVVTAMKIIDELMEGDPILKLLVATTEITGHKTGKVRDSL